MAKQATQGKPDELITDDKIKQEQALTIVKDDRANLPAELDYGSDLEGAGLENLSAEELAVPFFAILQALSPQVDNSNAAFIKGAEVGMFIDTASNVVFSTFEAVFCHRTHNFGRWIPRTAGGGFEGVYEADDPFVAKLRQEQGQFGVLKFNAEPDPANPQSGGPRELVETFYLFGYGRPEGGRWQRFMLSFRSTQIKKYKNLLSFIHNQLVYDHPDGSGKLIRPPLWAHKFKCSTLPEENKKGKFRGWKIELAGGTKEASLVRPTDDVFLAAKEFWAGLREGKARVDYGQQAATGEGAEGGAPDDKEIPF